MVDITVLLLPTIISAFLAFVAWLTKHGRLIASSIGALVGVIGVVIPLYFLINNSGALQLNTDFGLLVLFTIFNIALAFVNYHLFHETHE